MFDIHYFFVNKKGIYTTFLCLFQYAAFVLIFFLAKLVVVILWFVWNDKVSTRSLLFLVGRSMKLSKGKICQRSKTDTSLIYLYEAFKFAFIAMPVKHQWQPCCVFRSRHGWRRSYLVSFKITTKTMIWPPTKYLLPGTTCSCL